MTKRSIFYLWKFKSSSIIIEFFKSCYILLQSSIHNYYKSFTCKLLLFVQIAIKSASKNHLLDPLLG